MKRMLLGTSMVAMLVSCGTQKENTSEVNSWNESKKAYESGASEPWDEQMKVDAKIPQGDLFSWMHPTQYNDFGGFWSYEIHEGVDYVNTSRTTNIPVVAAVNGEVVYIRIGCPQSSEGNDYDKNLSTRNCGGGWGNHIVLKHTSGNTTLYTRYAHLKPGGIKVDVGQKVVQGQQIAIMGNAGSSNVRHLHFEMGTRSSAFDPRKGNQNFDKVYNPEKLSYKAFALKTVVPRDPSLPPESGKLMVTVSPFTWVKKSMAQAEDIHDESQKCKMTTGGALFYKNLEKVNDNYYKITQDSASGICPQFKVGDTLYLYKPHFSFEKR